MSRRGDYFLRFETNEGSGEQGCVQLFRRGLRYPRSAGTPQLTYVTWLGHTCDNDEPAKSHGMAIEYFEAKGELLWVKKP